MRPGLLLALALGGCTAESGGAFLAANAASIPVIQRTIPDAVISLVTGRNCSVVWLDRGERYCRPTEPAPTPAAVCTRTLGVINCWTGADGLAAPVHEVADGPRRLTPEQEADRTARWPKL